MAAPALSTLARQAVGAFKGAGASGAAAGRGGALARLDEARAGLDRVQQVLPELSAQALAYSWRLLIKTFGLTLIYINFHFVAKYFAHSRHFSEFGQSLRIGKSGVAAGKIPFQDLMKWGEIITMIVLDMIVAILLLCAFVIFMLQALVLVSPLLLADLFGCSFYSYLTSSFTSATTDFLSGIATFCPST